MSLTTEPVTAILLVAHGSRRAAANQDLVELAELLRRDGHAIVEVSYLELAEPSIPAGGRACVAAGAERVLMFPYFLSAGVHVATDLEEFRQQLAAEFPQVTFQLTPHLGLHPLMVEIVKDRLRQVPAAVTPPVG